jgi:hypothetical protein
MGSWSTQGLSSATYSGAVYTRKIAFAAVVSLVATTYHLKNSRLKVHALTGCHNEGKWA